MVYDVLEINNIEGETMGKFLVEFEVTAEDFENAKACIALDRLNGGALGSSNGLDEASALVIAKDGLTAATKFLKEYKTVFGHPPLRWLPDIVNYSAIAKRTGFTAEAIRLYALNERGPGNFPKPISVIGQGSLLTPVWNWPEVFNWMVANEKLENEYLYPTQNEIMLINGELAIKQPA